MCSVMSVLWLSLQHIYLIRCPIHCENLSWRNERALFHISLELHPDATHINSWPRSSLSSQWFAEVQHFFALQRNRLRFYAIIPSQTVVQGMSSTFITWREWALVTPAHSRHVDLFLHWFQTWLLLSIELWISLIHYNMPFTKFHPFVRIIIVKSLLQCGSQSFNKSAACGIHWRPRHETSL